MMPPLMLLLAIPAVAACLVMAAGRWPNLRDSLSLLAGIALFIGVCCWIAPVMAGARPSVTLLQVMPALDITFTLEPLGLIFALVASGLWPLTTLYAIGYMRGNSEGHQTRFFAFFALAITAAIGIALAGNLITLLIFYEALTFSTYPLVAHKGTDEAKRGGRTYLGILLATSIGLFLPAIVITWLVAGRMDFVLGGILEGHLNSVWAAGLFALFLFGIGKAALMPFHRWLPAAMIAPTPVSALLHAVAVVKAGVFAILKITVYIFGMDFTAGSGLSEPMMWVAAFTLIAASVIALSQDNLKARLAYSTISQLAYVVLGATLASRLAIAGAGMHIVMHAVGKITLFFCAGAIYTAAHKKLVSEFNGLGRAMPFTFAAFLIASLSIIGLPPLGGTWSKWYLMLGALEAGHAILIGVLMLSSLLSIAYLMPIPIRGFFMDAQNSRRFKEAPWQCVVPLCLTAATCVALFFIAGPLYALLLSIGNA